MNSSTTAPRQLAAPAAAAIGYGALAGVITAIMLALMHGLQHQLWHLLPHDNSFVIAAVVMLAGVAIAALGTRLPRDEREDDLESQIARAATVREYHRGRGLIIAAIAIISVVAGGSLGPEAGIIAVVAELSALVSQRIKDSHYRQLITTVGVEASLGAIYGSPPGGVAFQEKEFTTPKMINIAGAIAGFIGFILTHKLFSEHRLQLPFADADGASLQALGVALLAGVAGLLVGAVFAWVDHAGYAVAHKLPNSTVTTLVGSAVLAGVFALFPALMFSGQAELEQLLTTENLPSPGWLLLVAAAKILITVLCIRCGWKGGSFFPLLLIGGAAGVAVVAFGDPTPAIVSIAAAAGIAAATTAALRKPLLVILVMLFIAPAAAHIPMLIGVGLGMLAKRFTPEPVAH